MMDEAQESESLTYIFEFSFDSGYKKPSTLAAPIQLPLSCTVKEYVGRFMQAHKIPEYVENDLHEKLNSFIDATLNTIHDGLATECMASLTSSDNIDSKVNQWANAFSQHVKSCRGPQPVSDIDIFGQAFHTVIHSPHATTLLALEYQYTKSIQERLRQRGVALSELEAKHSHAMQEAIDNIGSGYSEAQVSHLATKHCESVQIIQSQYASELSALRSAHKVQFTATVMRLYEQLNNTTPTSPSQAALPSMPSTMPEMGDHTQPDLQESFTVSLGAQLKTTHNIRLVCLNPLTLCRPNAATNISESSDDNAALHPQRLQTMMSLYSTSLCGLVLLVDDRINSFKGIKKDFADLCEQGPELHFPELEEQLEGVRQQVRATNSGGVGADTLPVGSVYVTRHSGLAQLHVVLHLVVDDSLTNGDITSRHPAILALRNILKTACRCDITTLSLPLLLTYDLTEEMTVPWCMKRAELVFKCVKGFMIEMSSWDVAHRSHTVQFIVPEGISGEMFTAFSNMLPQIFTVSRPLMLTSN